MATPSLRFVSKIFHPKRYQSAQAGNWSGHLPFARDLVAAVCPSLFVELGTRNGESYFGFCQALSENGIACKAYAIINQAEKSHSESRNRAVYDELTAYNQANYSGFSYLLNSSFDEALTQFSDNSINILHLAGHSSLEAASRHFHAWLPKVKPGGLILLHGTAFRHNSAALWKLWETLKTEGETFEFHHNGGLGVFLKPGSYPAGSDLLKAMFNSSHAEEEQLRRSYFLLALELEWNHRNAAPQPDSDAETSLRVYLHSPTALLPEEVSTAKVKTGEWQKITVELLGDFGSNASYINLANRPALVDVWSITLRAVHDQQVLWSADAAGVCALETSGTLQQIKSEPEQNHCRFFNYGADPRLRFPHLNSEQFNQPLLLEIWLRVQTNLQDLLSFVQQHPEVVPHNASNGLTQPAISGPNGTAAPSAAPLEAQLELLRAERDQLLKEANQKQTHLYLLKASQKSMKDTEAELADLKGKFARLEKQYEALEESHQQLTDEYNGLEETFNNVVQSRSWRLTSMLRGAARPFKER